MRVDDGQTLTTDGPFAETKEVFAGYYVFELDNLDAAIEHRGACPGGTARRLGRGAPAGARLIPTPVLDSVFRRHWGRVVASLVGYLGDFELAEDAAQEAFAIAAERWPRQGTPENPVAWLITTARNRAIDRIRRERALAAKARLLERDEAVEDDVNDLGSDQIGDERLELLFTCCHPALSTEAQVALTLRTLGGLTNDEIARAFLVSAGDDEAPPLPRAHQDQARGDPVQRARRRACSRSASAPSWRSSISSSTRATAAASTWPRRRSPWARCSQSSCPTRPRSTPCSP